MNMFDESNLIVWCFKSNNRFLIDFLLIKSEKTCWERICALVIVISLAALSNQSCHFSLKWSGRSIEPEIIDVEKRNLCNLFLIIHSSPFSLLVNHSRQRSEESLIFLIRLARMRICDVTCSEDKDSIWLSMILENIVDILCIASPVFFSIDTTKEY